MTDTPSDRLLIDALAICAMQQFEPLDLEKAPTYARLLNEARAIVRSHAIDALETMANVEKAKRAAQAPAVIYLTEADALFAGGGSLEINTRVQQTIDRLSLALRCKEPIRLDATGERIFLVTEIAEQVANNNYTRIKLRLRRADAPDTEEVTP